jgi:hypothetical protein
MSVEDFFQGGFENQMESSGESDAEVRYMSTGDITGSTI